MIYKSRGLTVVEVMISLSICVVLFASVYSVFNRSFFGSQKNMDNLNALQEMALIIYNLRSDLQSYIELDGLDNSKMKYDNTNNSFSFLMVSGMDEKGSSKYNMITYELNANGSFIRTAREFKKQSEGIVAQKKLASLNSISKFNIKLFTKQNIEINNNDAATASVTAANNSVSNFKPHYIEVFLRHKTNAQLETNIVLCSLYTSKKNISKGNCWVSGPKLSAATAMSPYYDHDNVQTTDSGASESLPDLMGSSYPNQL